MTKLKLDFYYLINGLWSGIPLCCIWYFIKVSRIHPNDTAYQVEHKRGNVISVTDAAMELKDSITSYVSCDKCYSSQHSVPIRNNGTICDWLLK